ncbi:MAG: AarF/ABC1/UbiB kinase family protein [Roseiflexaceae bacterium]
MGMWPLVRQARYLGRYRQIAQVMGRYGFGFLVEQLGIGSLLRLPSRLTRRPPANPLSGPQRLRMALVELGPTYVKLGQVLSTRPDLLPPAFVAELNRLQDTVPPFPADQSVAVIETELGRPIAELFASFEREPFAAASLGQVHAATLKDGTSVVVKVQRPDIQQTVAVDLAILTELATLAQERSELGQRYQLVDLAWEFGALMRGELDFRQEGRNADRFRRNFAGNPGVKIPLIYWDYTTARVLTSERIVGVKINDIAGMDAIGLDRKKLARNSIELILQEIFKDGYFQGDPHPGNMFALPGEVIGAVDFGQAISLEPEMTRQLLHLLASLSGRDADGALRALQGLGMLRTRTITPVLRRDMVRFIEEFVDRPLSEISARETVEELLGLVQRHELHMPPPLALLLKAIIMMEGIGVLIDPHLDVFAVARPYALQTLTEFTNPEAIARRAGRKGRDLLELADQLPHQAGEVLAQLREGELTIRTRDLELVRVASSLSRAGTRLALAIVLLAAALGTGLGAVAVAIGGWSGPLILGLFGMGAVVVVVCAIALVIGLVQGD